MSRMPLFFFISNSQHDLQCVTSLVHKGWNEELLFDLTSCHVRFLSVVGLNEKKEKFYLCDPDDCCFLTLSAPQSLFFFLLFLVSRLDSYWQLEASSKGDLASIFLCHLVWSGTDSVWSFSKTKPRPTALSCLLHLVGIWLCLICCCRCVAHCLGKCV